MLMPALRTIISCDLRADFSRDSFCPWTRTRETASSPYQFSNGKITDHCICVREALVD